MDSVNSVSQNRGKVASYESDVQSCNLNVRVLRNRCVTIQNNENSGEVRKKSDRKPCRSENVNTSVQSSNDTENVKVNPSDQFSHVKTGVVTRIHFSFEDIPEREAWYQTFLRQDRGEEYNFSTGSEFNYMKSLPLPYEIVSDHFDTLNKNTGLSQTTNVTTMGKSKNKKKVKPLNKEVRRSPRCQQPNSIIFSRLGIHKRKKRESVKTSDDNFSRSAEENISSPEANSAHHSNQHPGIDDLTQNLDLILSLYSENGLSYDNHVVSTVDANNAENQGKVKKLRGSKYRRTRKKTHFDCTKKSITDNLKYELDVDPAVLEELAVSDENSLSCVDTSTLIPIKKGPSMDIISFLNDNDSCCAEEFMEI